VSYKSPTHLDSDVPASTQSLISSHTNYLLNTYARPPILLTHGSGSTLYDSLNRPYLDFTAGIAVTALGHNDAGINKVMADQAGKVSHASNVYWNEWAGELAKSIIEGTRQHGGLGLSRGSGGKVFFSNSGTEANEGALKFARLVGKQTSPTKTGIVCFTNAFHGRSLGALSCTPNPKYQAPFEPLIPGVRVGEYNEMDQSKIDALVDESVCGVIVEPIQGEGGVGTGRIEWLEMLGKRCREVGAVLIFDEIQVGSSWKVLILVRFVQVGNHVGTFDIPRECSVCSAVSSLTSDLTLSQWQNPSLMDSQSGQS
jgi:acetylornithine aminotransferase